MKSRAIDAIYSAATTFISFFGRENRYLTRGSRLMIYERELMRTLNIDGPLTARPANVQATMNEIQCAIAAVLEDCRRRIREAGTAAPAGRSGSGEA